MQLQYAALLISWYFLDNISHDNFLLKSIGSLIFIKNRGVDSVKKIGEWESGRGGGFPDGGHGWKRR